MDVEDGEVSTETKDQILSTMVADAAEYFDTEFSDSETTAIRIFYEPVAEQLLELQENSALILESTQLDNAEGDALEFLCSLIGVDRREDERAEGEVVFYRDEPSDTRDYSIPSGVMVRTEGTEETIIFRTTESVTLEQGETEVYAEIEAEDPGSRGNVASNTIEVIRDNIPGIDGVTNPNPTNGGNDEENDDELRERARENLAEGSRATARAIVTAVRNLDGVSSVYLFKNDGDMGDMPGWELIVQGGNGNDIAETIAENIAAGDTTYGGINGKKVKIETELPNGQEWEIEFSRPEEVDIHVEAKIVVEDEYAGDTDVKDEITSYIGGTNTSGSTVVGDITVGDDVIYGEVEYAIRSVEGVYDVEVLEIDTAEPPEGDENINIEDYEVAVVDANEDIDISTEDR